MKKFENVDTAILCEMLAEHTQELTRMLTKAISTKSYAKHKKLIAELQTEIAFRQTPHINTRFRPSDESFQE